MEGLIILHDAGRYHGNLKTTNVMLFGKGDQVKVKLTDFEGYPGIG